MTGKAKDSPTSRKVPDLQERIKRLEAFEAWGAVHPIPFESYADPKLWDEYWKLLAHIHDMLLSAQTRAVLVQKTLIAKHQRPSERTNEGSRQF